MTSAARNSPAPGLGAAAGIHDRELAAMRALAWQAEARQDRPRADALMQADVLLAEPDAHAWQRWGRHLWRLGNLAAAAAALGQAAARAPGCPGVLLDRGALALASGDLDLARAALTTAEQAALAAGATALARAARALLPAAAAVTPTSAPPPAAAPTFSAAAAVTPTRASASTAAPRPGVAPPPAHPAATDGGAGPARRLPSAQESTHSRTAVVRRAGPRGPDRMEGTGTARVARDDDPTEASGLWTQVLAVVRRRGGWTL